MKQQNLNRFHQQTSKEQPDEQSPKGDHVHLSLKPRKDQIDSFGFLKENRLGVFLRWLKVK